MVPDISENRGKTPQKNQEENEEEKNLEMIVEPVISPHEVIRDPIHGDIWITLLEREIIDTLVFQKLRGKMQLGPTHLVYPGATHNRFEHSVGTLFVADKLASICNKNCENYPELGLQKISKYQRLLIRLVALLHDTAHVPFGHTLEREGNLFEKHEWKDEKRAEKILGIGTEIYKAVIKTLGLFGFSEKQAEKVISDVQTILVNDGDSMDLKYPFIGDIVGNTLCADLLDYCVRDMYNCGLVERSGDRFLNYLGILPLTKSIHASEEEFEVATGSIWKGRLALLAYRYERDRRDPKEIRPVPKPDVLSEAIDLLRKRYSLAEKIYFHRTKIAASAMLISAIYAEGLDTGELFDLTDDQLLSRLSKSTNERAKNIAVHYLRRNLFKPVYRLGFKEKSEIDRDSVKLWDQVYRKYRDPKTRNEAEQKIEKEMGLAAGSVAIYCPESGMNTKEFEALVQSTPGSVVKPLRGFLDPLRKQEMEVIDKYFRRLWFFAVFVNPEQRDPLEVSKPEVRLLSGYCEDLFDLQNEIEGLEGAKTDFIHMTLGKAREEWEAAHPDELVPQKFIEEIAASAHRYSSNKDSLKKELYSRVTKHYDELKKRMQEGIHKEKEGIKKT
jgi:HD superfamily phosphohydrolase